MSPPAAGIAQLTTVIRWADLNGMLLPVRSRIAKLRDLLRYGLWFVPVIVVLFGLLLGFLLPAVDRMYGDSLAALRGLVPDAPATMRSFLRLIAGSMITVATTAFSITIVALQLASSQLGPRLLRNFLRDRTNQLVFGVLLATFVYCVVVLQGISLPFDGTEPGSAGGGAGGQAVGGTLGAQGAVASPAVSFLGAGLLAMLSVVFFIVFIHHTASSVQTDTVIADVSRELDFSLDRLFPMTIGSPPPIERVDEEGSRAQRFPGAMRLKWEAAVPVRTRRSGYIQAIDGRFLLAFAERHDVVIRLERRPGDFVEKGTTVALVLRRDGRSLENASERRPPLQRLLHVFIIGIQRTQQQDVAFVFHQLVEIALRALSPGINDSFTAMRCIDRLTDAMIHVGENAFPSPYRYGSGGKLRVIAPPLSFSVVLSLVFNPIAESAVDRSMVVLHLFDAIARIARRARSDESRKALDALADYVLYLAQTSSAYEATQERIHAAYTEVNRALRGPVGD